MTDREPAARLLNTAFDAPTSWAEARRRIEESRETFWLATTRPNGSPHVRPILGVWVDDALHFVSGSTTAKTRYLASNPLVTVTMESHGIDLVVEGSAERVTDQGALQRVADAYQAKYGWAVTVRDGAFHDTEGAPTAGPPPYEVSRVAATKAFGFPNVADTYGPTRWSF